METVKRISVMILTVLFCVLLVCLPAAAETGPDEGPVILAERVDCEQIRPGDRIVIVCDAVQNTLSREKANTRLAAVSVTLEETPTRKVLTFMDKNAAVFEVISTDEDDLLYFKCDEGYLTSADTGNGLFYASEPTECSKWQFRDSAFLYCPNVVYTSDGKTYQNYYLEYYSDGGYYSIYGINDYSVISDFRFGFYRIGNSIPGEPILSDTYYCLPVFETSDTHGYLADISGDRPLYLLSYISDKLKDVRGYGSEERTDLAVLLDGGDIYQGNPLSNLLEGQPLSAAYSEMGYDAVTIGNHEFDWGIEVTVDADATMMDSGHEEFTADNQIPVVVSNMYLNGEKVTFARDYVILDKTAVNTDGEELPVRIGVIGFAGDYSSGIMYPRFTGAGYSIILDYDRLNILAAELEQSGQCDATILLTHQNAYETALAIGEDSVIDLVLGGHTHENMCGLMPCGLRFLQPSCYGSAYAYSELAFDLEGDSPVFRTVINAKCIPVTDEPDALTASPENADELDPAMTELTDNILDALSDVLETQIGYLTQSAERYVYMPDSEKRGTTMGNWQASIIARIGGADIAFVNNGGLRTDFILERGKDRRYITLADLYTMFPFNNKICVFELTYGELLTALQYSLTENGWTLLSQMVGIDCYYTGQTIHAIVTADGEPIYRNGAWQEGWKEKKVLVAVSDYIATTERTSWGMSNPFYTWMDTDRLISSDVIDNEGARIVLQAEAKANDGHLSIDPRPHYINLEYPPEASDSVTD